MVASTSCSYPEFGFAGDSALVADSSVADTGQAPVDAAADSISEDTDLLDATRDAVIDVVDAMVDDVADATLDTTIATDTQPETLADVATDTRDASSDTRDAAIDTRDAADTAPRPCALSHYFCSDFDTSTLPADGWSGSFQAATGMLALDTTTSTSTPQSLVASLGTGTVTSSAMVARRILSVPLGRTIRIEADMMVDTLPYISTYDLILFKIQRSTAGDGVSVTAGGTGLKLATQGATNESWPITGIVAGKWFHVRLEAVLHTTAGVARIYIDGAATPQIEKTGLSTANMDDTTGRELVVGVFGYTASSPYRVHYDDVSIDLN